MPPHQTYVIIYTCMHYTWICVLISRAYDIVHGYTCPVRTRLWSYGNSYYMLQSRYIYILHAHWIDLHIKMHAHLYAWSVYHVLTQYVDTHLPCSVNTQEQKHGCMCTHMFRTCIVNISISSKYIWVQLRFAPKLVEVFVNSTNVQEMGQTYCTESVCQVSPSAQNSGVEPRCASWILSKGECVEFVETCGACVLTLLTWFLC